jgi:hypothetical protein
LLHPMYSQFLPIHRAQRWHLIRDHCIQFLCKILKISKRQDAYRPSYYFLVSFMTLAKSDR